MSLVKMEERKPKRFVTLKHLKKYSLEGAEMLGEILK